MTATDTLAPNIDCCTVASKNFLPQLRAMVRSYRAHHPGGRIFVLLVDDADGIPITADALCLSVRITDLPIESLSQMRMRYGVADLCAAVRPTLIKYLFERHNAEHIVYLDPDLFFTGPMVDLPLLFKKHEILLTPQITAPFPNGQVAPSEFSVLSSGSFNSGFVGLTKGMNASAFLDWWETRLKKYCFRRPQEQMFGDQRWLDLVPMMFEGVHIIRDPSYNIASWNLHERPLDCRDGRFFVRGTPAAFFHMSGFRPGSPPTFCGYAHLFPLAESDALKKLSRIYQEALVDGGYDEKLHLEYDFDRFDNGVCICPVIRRIYDSLGESAKRFGDPLQTDNPDSFFVWLTQPLASGPNGSTLTNLHASLFMLIPEAHLRFPTLTRTHFADFGRWLLREERLHKTFDLDPVFLAPLLPLQEPVRRTTLRDRTNALLWKRHTCAPYQFLCKSLKTLIGRRIYYSLKPLPLDVLLSIRPAINTENTRGITVVGCLQAESGIGEGLRGHILALQTVGVPVRGINIRSAPGRQEERLPEIPLSTAVGNGAALFVGSPDELPMIQRSVERDHGGRRIAHIAWELSFFPERYLPLLRSLDEIWAPSRFAADSIGMLSPVPVLRIPYVIDTTPTQWKQRKDFRISEKRFVFLFIFDYFSTIERKNPLQLIESFRRAFGDDPSVLLVLKTSHGKDAPDARERVLSAIGDAGNILVIDEYLTRPEVLDLIRCCDSYVSLHRSEGFGMPLAEAMSLGKPVIATNYGGSTDFLDATCGYPIAYRLSAITTSIGPYDAGALWAEPDTDHAAALLREVFTNREEATSRAERAEEVIKSRFSSQTVGELMRRRLEVLASQA